MQSTIENGRPRAFDPAMRDRVGPARTPGWDLATERRVDDGEGLANSIAWFSIGLGAAQLVAAGTIARHLGMDGKEELIRVYGVREVVKGAGILSRRQPVEWMLARIAGDFLDLGTLATALKPGNRRRSRVVGAMVAVAGVTALDIVAARQLYAAREHRIRH